MPEPFQNACVNQTLSDSHLLAIRPHCARQPVPTYLSPQQIILKS